MLQCYVCVGFEPATSLSVWPTYAYSSLLSLRASVEDLTWHQCVTYWLIRLALNVLTTMIGDQGPTRVANKQLQGDEPSDNNWLDEIHDSYYNPSSATGFSTYGRLLRKAKTLPGAVPSEVKPWLEKQDNYALHWPVRNRFPRNPYTVSNILDLFEADLVDVQSLAKYNDGHRYLLTVTDVFTKYLHIVQLKSKLLKLSVKRLKRF